MSESINKKVLLTVLIFGCFLSTLNQTLLNVALSNLMDVFSVSATTVQWLATGFMLVNGVLVPITAYLMKRFSTRQLFISSMLFLLVGSIFCAVAPNFITLLIGRMIQAVGAGIIMPLLMSIVMFIFPPEKRGSMMGLIGLAMIFAPAIAPTLAGFIIDYYSWRWLFIGIIPFVVIVIFMAMKYLINVSETANTKLDVVSVILSTIGFGLILYGFSNAGSHGWGDNIVIVSILVGIMTTALFCLRQMKSSDPLLNLSVFKNKVFTLTSIINIIVTMMMYADMILLPIYLQNGRGFTALDAGLLLLPGALVNAFMSPVTGKMYDRFGAKPLFIIGLIFVIPSMWVVTDLTETTTFSFLMIRTIFLRIGLSFITMPLNTAGLNALPKTLVTHGTAVNNTLRQIAGAIGSAVVITIFTAQTTNHAKILLGEIPNATAESIRTLASILGSSDAYYFMTILAILAFVLTLFVPSKKRVNNSL
ncbi:MFS transporter [Lysinibacillus sphaericus]|uniref:DHA2 family efflux MFS transporter permease subunit n=1 Tax=Lysinibacillus sphaericus TaxID=1421 RepID=UPI0018CFB05D|nr:DHA2 family efflux MFS transporter permease subunit [Lysinibacillus sphaericus]MBG9454946.1 MFS transporter [Lysinibacillus sphaericus]MBG9478983.1 MFS transporter [Lysinibacillus sphaericus]MBG9593321.1 MFS transporter [Lysinibacillus sphaericus]